MIRGVYIHIPFCHQICHYCDFNKVFFKQQPVDEYIEALGLEMAMAVEQNPTAFEKVETIFLGGGTPTALSVSQLERLLQLIYTYIPTKHMVELTSEANPDELTVDKLQVLYNSGVNRLSMGVQSFDEGLLKKIGRTHARQHIEQAIHHARQVGFRNISIDLMYGLPDQTMEQWAHTLHTALSYDLPHYSAYSLIVEPKTVFYIRYVKGKLILPTQDLEADMYELLMHKMEKKQLSQYEISNFAQKGFASLHNQIYWDNDEYAGFGAGAHGYMNGVRYANIAPIKKYIEAVNRQNRPLLSEHVVTLQEQIEEQLFLGLRKTVGVTHADYERKFCEPISQRFTDVLQQLVQKELLIEDSMGIRLTRKGRFVGNEVFQKFLIEE